MMFPKAEPSLLTKQQSTHGCTGQWGGRHGEAHILVWHTRFFSPGGPISWLQINLVVTPGTEPLPNSR
eukprot:8456467-Ditylum_brightwellii.AAC.1